jgi:hypothetical protein
LTKLVRVANCLEDRNEVLGYSMLSHGGRMAAKKKAKSKTKVAKNATAAGTKVAKKGKAAGKKVVKKATAGRVVAKTFLGRLAQRSAQLVLDSGLLGDVPPKRRAPAKKPAR